MPTTLTGAPRETTIYINLHFFGFARRFYNCVDMRGALSFVCTLFSFGGLGWAGA